MGRIISYRLPSDSDQAYLKYTAVENYDHFKEQYGVTALFSI